MTIQPASGRSTSLSRRQFAASVSCGAVAALSGLIRLDAADKKNWRVGVIGHTGRGDYGHGLDAMWQKIPQAEIVAVADAQPAGLAAAQKKLGNVAGFADYRKLLSEVKPDVVAIAPRHVDQHHTMCLAAIEAGVRGIYIEKPFCATLSEADEIAAACKQKNVKLAVAHRNRYHPALSIAKDLISAGEIGSVLEIRGRGKEDARGGVQDLWVLGCHVFNQATYLSGAPLACSAQLYKDKNPCTPADVRPGSEGIGPIAGNALHARFEMADGTPFFFDSIANQVDKQTNFGLQLIGTKGVIDFRIDTEPLVHLRRGNPNNPAAPSQPWLPITSAGIDRPESAPDVAAKVAGHQFAGADLLDAIEKNRAPICDVEAGRTTIEMIFAVFASHCRDGARVPLPLKDREHGLKPAS